MEIHIEPFRPEQAAEFEALNRAWLSDQDLLEPADEPQLTDPVGEILEPGGHIVVAVRAGHVVGTCALAPHGPTTFELAKLAVAPDLQGQGIGRRLVEACLRLARESGRHRVVLLSNGRLVSALRLYERMGFERRPVPTDSPYATADIYMELELR
jgi:predicted N-acetyltransferase YhbS